MLVSLLKKADIGTCDNYGGKHLKSLQEDCNYPESSIYTYWVLLVEVITIFIPVFILYMYMYIASSNETDDRIDAFHIKLIWIHV